MKTSLVLLLILAPGLARAACPAQPASLDLTGGTGRVCVVATPTAPVDRVEIRFTSAAGSPVVVPVLPTPPATTLADGTIVSWTVPSSVRGTGNVVGVAINATGEAAVTVPATFRAFDAPARPTLLPAP